MEIVRGDEAWQRIPETTISAICDQNIEKAEDIARRFSIDHCYSDWQEMIDKEKPDFVDIITPPDTHLQMCKCIAEKRLNLCF